MNTTEVIKIIQANRNLLEKYSVRNLAVFGSVVHGETEPKNDVDLLV